MVGDVDLVGSLVEGGDPWRDRVGEEKPMRSSVGVGEVGRPRPLPSENGWMGVGS